MTNDLMGVILKKRIKDHTAKVAVVGLGYVGTPVAALWAEAGFQVSGYDIQQPKVDLINKGISPIEGKEPGLAELVNKVVEKGNLKAYSRFETLGEADVVLVMVETPVDDKTKLPRYRALTAALKSIGEHLKSGTLIIIESTIAPKTMDTVVKPLLEKTSGLKLHKDFFLVHCPERLMPGRLLEIIRTYDRVVGASSKEAGEVAVAFYSQVVKGQLDTTDLLSAEVVKTSENTLRAIEIAAANEFAIICEDLGADVWEVRKLINKRPDRNMLKPGAGVGGHCLPKDFSLLTANVHNRSLTKVIAAAQEVNDRMPIHTAQLLVDGLRSAGAKDVNGYKIAVLGYSYLENSDDTRNSPSAVLVDVLESWGFEVVIHDPYVNEYKGDVYQTVKGADAVVIMVAHDEYFDLDWSAIAFILNEKVIVDGRNVLGKENAKKLGVTYRAIGVGV